MELSAPVVCEQYELRADPPAPGKWRGGIGSTKRWRFLSPTSIGSTGDHRGGDLPKGLFGGGDGLPGSMVRTGADAVAEPLPAKVSGLRLERGDTLQITGISGAGYGSPLERDSQAVADDVRFGLIDTASARTVYAVALMSDGSVDLEETDRLRAARGDLDGD